MINSIHVIIEYYPKYYGKYALNCYCKLLKDKAIYERKILSKNRVIFYHAKSTRYLIINYAMLYNISQ